MPGVRVGFLGFGEVAAVFAAAIRQRAVEVVAYDVLLDRDDSRAALERRAGAGGVRFCSRSELFDDALCVLSTVTTDVAVDAARACLAYFEPGRVYPSVAEKICRRARSARHSWGFQPGVACSSGSPSVKLNHRPIWPGIEKQSIAPRRTETI